MAGGYVFIIQSDCQKCQISISWFENIREKITFQIQCFNDLPPDMLRDNDGFRPAS